MFPKRKNAATVLRSPLRGWSRRTASAALAALAAGMLLGGCVYRLNIQQGNLIDKASLDKVQVGMTRSQVEFLLGTPMIADSFHQDRWDYPYYLSVGRKREYKKSWFAVYFKNDRVARIDRDAFKDETEKRPDTAKAVKEVKAEASSGTKAGINPTSPGQRGTGPAPP